MARVRTCIAPFLVLQLMLGPLQTVESNPLCDAAMANCISKRSELLTYYMNSGFSSQGIASFFEMCMKDDTSTITDASCCCCDSKMKLAIYNYIQSDNTLNNLAASLPDFQDDPMQCQQRTNPYDCPVDNICPESCSDASDSLKCSGSAVKDDSGTCRSTCDTSDFGDTSTNCCMAPPQSCSDAPGDLKCSGSAVRDNSGTCGPTCDSSDFGDTSTNCCMAPPQSCSDASDSLKCSGSAVKDDSGTCRSTCGSNDFGDATANCCKVDRMYSWRVKINATWTDTNCKIINSIVPIMMSSPQLQLKEYFSDEKVLTNAMSCVDFGECEEKNNMKV